MSQPPGRSAGRYHVTLNTDGKRHPLENALTLAALSCGLIAFMSGLFVPVHVVASWAGVLGFVGGLYAQYVSATTAERSLNIVAIVASFVGTALGIYHGGFIP
ncbi:hypothetical protein DQ384_18245 [Sphaerisporangium album]|uniref:Uncharacterized protein n=1 Tax=Sphaerisporangium album TaxID=509200 RepID=A0A367FKA9_9ACTN|nr:hypothetical protein [Sphaerisporangium album]RCG30147.1 hypothetical protein DQ384_18245 [Sphaerisporangium album]